MKKSFSAFIFLSILFFGISSCEDSKVESDFTSEEIAEESAKLNTFFEREFQKELAESPMLQTRLGIKTDYGKWDNFSHLRYAKDLEKAKKRLSFLEDSIEVAALNEESTLSYRLYKRKLETVIEDYDYRFYNYPINQMFGIQTQIPTFLINMHQISSVEDAQAYISRLKKLPQVFRDVLKAVQLREFNGIVPPQFVFDLSIESSQNILRGKPFEKSSEQSTLLTDFKGKIASLNVSSEEKNKLLIEAQRAMVDSVQPAYKNLISSLEDQRQRATTDDGVWKLPKGKEYYKLSLRRYTDSNLTAEDLHEIGLNEVARIHAEMEKVKEEIGFKGSLQDFFEFMRSDEQFYYENTPEGRQKYIEGSKAILNSVKGRLDELFLEKPDAELVVKNVEAFREKSAPLASYYPPSLHGSRPGIYFLDLYDMPTMPKYQMEALAYHHGIPGNHLQISLAQEMDSLPMFRRLGIYPAYVEGWGLYSEQIPKEIGLYEDPYSDFGRLAAELWYAIGLVVDTGIHSQKWTHEEAIAYYKKNSPAAETDAIKMVERQIVMPGQATAYQIGMLKIIELREKAKEELGDEFDIKEFHEAVLGKAAVPLNILEEQVMKWIESKKS